jgi:hypothetical protein
MHLTSSIRTIEFQQSSRLPRVLDASRALLDRLLWSEHLPNTFQFFVGPIDTLFKKCSDEISWQKARARGGPGVELRRQIRESLVSQQRTWGKRMCGESRCLK